MPLLHLGCLQPRPKQAGILDLKAKAAGVWGVPRRLLQPVPVASIRAQHSPQQQRQKQHGRRLLLLCLLAAVPGSLSQPSPGFSELSSTAGSAHWLVPDSGVWPQQQQESSALLRQLRRRLLAANYTVPARFTKPYKICTSEWKPIVHCKAGQNESTFTGYQIELFRLLASDLGWQPSDYTFVCMDWTPMIDDLASPTGNCMMSAAGVEVSLDMLSRGIKFSWPIYRSGYSVLVSSHMVDGDTWGFARAFHYNVWLLLPCTSIAVALLVTVMENVTLKEEANKKGLQGWLWLSFSMLLWIHHHIRDPKLWSSRVILMAYGFLVLIMVHLYTATSASRITAQKLSNTITGKADLPGKEVETWASYVHIVRKYGIMADGMPWENDNDTAALIKNLRNNRYKALVLDTPVLEYLAGTDKLCDLFVVGESFETFSLALAFPQDMDDALIDAFTTSLVRLQSGSAALDRLENTYIKADGVAGCHAVSHAGGGDHGHGGAITIDAVSGLWYIMAISVGVSLVLLGIHNIRSNPVAMARLEKVTSSARRSLEGLEHSLSTASTVVKRSISLMGTPKPSRPSTSGAGGAGSDRSSNEPGATGTWLGQGSDNGGADSPAEAVRGPADIRQAASSKRVHILAPGQVDSDDEQLRI